MHIDLDAPVKSAGLSAGDIPGLIKRHGRNVLTPPPETPLWLQFVKGASQLERGYHLSQQKCCKPC